MPFPAQRPQPARYPKGTRVRTYSVGASLGLWGQIEGSKGLGAHPPAPSRLDRVQDPHSIPAYVELPNQC